MRPAGRIGAALAFKPCVQRASCPTLRPGARCPGVGRGEANEHHAGTTAYKARMQADPPPPDESRPKKIADRIVDAILAGQLAPGARLGEQSLADLFDVSRTIVREALTRLAARGMVEVNTRRGWFVVQPSRVAAREAFAARQVIETGLLQSLPARLDPAAIKR